MDDEGESIVEDDFLVGNIDVLGLRRCAESDGRNQQETKRAHELLLRKNVGRRTKPLVRAYPRFGRNRGSAETGLGGNSVGVYIGDVAGITRGNRHGVRI